MSGDELKKTIKLNNITLKTVADELGMSQQTFNSRLNAQNVKPDFVSRVLAIIDKCCPPLPAEMNTAIMGDVASYANVHQSAGASAATESEVKFLREQNARLQGQIEILTKQMTARDEQVGSLIKQVERLTQKLADMLPVK